MAEVVAGTERRCQAPGSCCVFPTKSGQLVDVVNGCTMDQGKHVNELNSTYFSCLPAQSPQELKWTLPPRAFNPNAVQNATFFYGLRRPLRSFSLHRDR